MSVSGQAITVQFQVIDRSTGAPVTGDAGNLTLRRVMDGVIGTITAAPAEVDATNMPGMYQVALTGAENTGTLGIVGGNSSTSNAMMIPVCWNNLDATIASRAPASGALTVSDLANLDMPISEVAEAVEAAIAAEHGEGSYQQSAAAVMTGTADPAGEQFALAVVRGDTVALQLVIVGDDLDGDGERDPIDITGASIVLSAQARELLDDRTASPLWSWTGSIVGDPANGTVSFARAAADTDNDSVECDVTYPAAIRITYAGGGVQTLRGTVVVRRDVLG
ncbi:MAG: hypothetical protein GYA36_21195 [Veillonellaceae bacterium]|nr:hypothetical protein [Veillonellaceae bacterium]